MLKALVGRIEMKTVYENHIGEWDMKGLSLNPALTPNLIERRWGEWNMDFLSLNPAIFKGGSEFSFMNWNQNPFTKQ